MRPAGLVAGVALAVLAALLWWARDPGRTAPFTPASVPAVRPTNVLLVSIDTVRPDHLSLYGYPRSTSPHLDAFARAALTYDNAYAPATFTSPSLVSMLTGLYPAAHGVRFLFQPLAEGTWTLPGYLRGRGWRTGAVVSNFVLNASASGLASQFDDYDDTVVEQEVRRGKKVVQRAAKDTTDAAIAWLDRHAAHPFFLWVHYIDPHGPYAAPAPFDRRFDGSPRREVKEAKIPDYQRILHIRDVGYYVDQYDGELAYSDEHLGRLLRAADGLGLLATTTVVVTSDHGETLTERHGGRPVWFDHGQDVWEELARVPLVVYRPGGPTGRSDALVCLTDIVPTLLAALGVPPPAAPFDGVPLEGTRGHDVIVESKDKAQRALRSGPFKLRATVDTAPVKAIRSASFLDLRSPVREGDAPPADGLAPAAPLAGALGTYLARDTQDLGSLAWEAEVARMKARAPRDPRVRADLDRLRALGYVQ